MPILVPWPAIRAVLLASLVCLGVVYCLHLRDENARLGGVIADLQTDLDAATELREADQAVAKRHTQRIAILTTKQKASDAQLQAALAANRDWAGSPVPPDVAAALGMPSPTQAP